ncbi:MAG: hypothetical protein ACLR5H_06065 [Oscillospiraceae bacterium]
MTATMAACGPKNTNTDADEKTMVYAVEAGSAGEDVARRRGWTVNSVQDQAAALMEVAAGTSDAAVIDLLMAGAMIGPDTSYPDLTYTDSLTQEEYGIGCRQGSDLADFITSRSGRGLSGRHHPDPGPAVRHPGGPAGGDAPDRLYRRCRRRRGLYPGQGHPGGGHHGVCPHGL